MSTYRELLLGCGHARDKRIEPDPARSGWSDLYTLDNYNQCNPDILGNCNVLGSWSLRDWGPRPFAAGLIEYARSHIEDPRLASESFDEVHAYEVLEHLGAQGDAVAFFSHFCEIWRILKPNGYLCATVPSRFSPWLWGDPSHRRLINEESLSFLDQDNYSQLDGPRPSTMSDFRNIYKADFRVIQRQDNHRQFLFILQAVKPSRVRERIA